MAKKGFKTLYEERFVYDDMGKTGIMGGDVMRGGVNGGFGVVFNQYAGGRKEHVFKKFFDKMGAVGRAFNIMPFVNMADRGDAIGDPYSHPKAAYAYGAYVGDPAVAGVARTIGEGVQYMAYSISAFHLNYWGRDPVYVPFTRAYNLDAIQDIRNTMNGARGLEFKP